ncbi:hypothetical protein H310_02684 [Aphanomyces invadans]|uniref:Uncharacterized protein n=1 Tax=Aphanomyces invadans TaxID=157072 RepID=A0A024UJV4_9STRA|nr:hypothetical protein H310_02684 [Aphanomyces invadans]ETW06425.1 hypothetical protein H310_02684 [Aphanomyces invadans]|eukprot:XP_008864500.1 hypothetical protein H310_02684 [Aphanomyces invadans]
MTSVGSSSTPRGPFTSLATSFPTTSIPLGHLLAMVVAECWTVYWFRRGDALASWQDEASFDKVPVDHGHRDAPTDAQRTLLPIDKAKVSWHVATPFFNA